MFGRKSWLISSLVIALGGLAQAQPPGTWQIEWTQADHVPIYAYYAYVDTPQQYAPLTPTCTPETAGFRCRAPFPPTLVPLLTNGPHTLVVGVVALGGYSLSDPLTLTSPAKPGAPQVTFTFTWPPA